MIFGIKSKKEKEQERLQKEREEREKREEKRRQLQVQFSDAKEQLANSLFGIEYGICNHEQLCQLDEAFRKRFPEVVQLLDQERRAQLRKIQDQTSNKYFHRGYNSCCYLQRNAVNAAILYKKDDYPELCPYIPPQE